MCPESSCRHPCRPTRIWTPYGRQSTPPRTSTAPTLSASGDSSQNVSAFAPATAHAVMALLEFHGISLRGKNVAVVGRSTVVGVPTAHLLTRADATVTVCHRQTTDLAARTRSAEIVVAAAGIPGLITAQHIAEGAVVIDVGTTTTKDGRLLGDVDTASVEGRARSLTPVPGGVGPVTTSLLLQHTVQSASTQYDRLRTQPPTKLAVISGRHW